MSRAGSVGSIGSGLEDARPELSSGNIVEADSNTSSRGPGTSQLSTMTSSVSRSPQENTSPANEDSDEDDSMEIHPETGGERLHVGTVGQRGRGRPLAHRPTPEEVAALSPARKTRGRGDRIVEPGATAVDKLTAGNTQQRSQKRPRDVQIDNGEAASIQKARNNVSDTAGVKKRQRYHETSADQREENSDGDLAVPQVSIARQREPRGPAFIGEWALGVHNIVAAFKADKDQKVSEYLGLASHNL